MALILDWKEGALKPYKDAGVGISELAGTMAKYLVFNTQDPRLADKRVRQAILYAVDRSAFLSGVLNNHGLLSNTIMHPGQFAYPQDLNAYKQDAEKAKKLLADAGWKDTNGDGVVEKAGKPFKISLIYYDSPVNNQVAPAIQQYLKQVGIALDIQLQDFNTVLAALQNKTKDQKFDLAFMGASYRANIGYGGSNFWMARYDDAKSKDLLKKGAVAPTEDAAKPIYQKWAKYINEEVPMCILFFEPEGTAFNKKLKNYSPVAYEWFPDVEKWYFEK